MFFHTANTIQHHKVSINCSGLENLEVKCVILKYLAASSCEALDCNTPSLTPPFLDIPIQDVGETPEATDKKRF